MNGALRAAALERLAFHLDRRPSQNPFEVFGAQLQNDLPKLVVGDSQDSTLTPSPRFEWRERRRSTFCVRI